MKPVLFNLFGIGIKGYGLMIALGICAAVITLNYRLKNKNYDEDSMFNMIMLTVIFGVLGGKLLYIISEINNIVKDPSILKEIGYGFVIYGAIIAGALTIYLYSKKKKWNVLEVLDLVIPSVALAQGFGRIGCFLAGCCYGAPTNMRIGVEFKDSPFCPAGVVRHPTQIYSAVFDLILALILFRYDKKEHKEGKTFGLYLIIYSIGRFIVEFLRDDPRGNVLFLSTSQFISIFTLILGVLLFVLPKKNIKVE